MSAKIPRSDYVRLPVTTEAPKKASHPRLSDSSEIEPTESAANAVVKSLYIPKIILTVEPSELIHSL
jgi:hypothetical protein